MFRFSKGGFFLFLSLAFNQTFSSFSLTSAFPNQLFISELNSISNSSFKTYNGIRPFIKNLEIDFNLSYNSNILFNKGHPNIDNYGHLYAINGFSFFNSVSMGYKNNWLIINLEPYKLDRSQYSHTKIDLSIFERLNSKIDYGTFSYLNNQYAPSDLNYKKSHYGLRESSLILHYKGFGFSYGNKSQWWGPGSHSSIILSSNVSGMNTYTLGTLKEIEYKNFSVGLRAIVSPYKSNNGTQLYLSALATNFTFNSSPSITFGLIRSYLSGNFKNLSNSTNLSSGWSIEDAFKLILEPLFGQSKINLDYTEIGTPGFDPWDEMLSAYVNFTFTEILLKFYIEIASDDNRANFTDLAAHWDHTLAYLIGFRKYYIVNNYKLLIGSEYFTNRPSNTFNPSFYRGDPNKSNYYVKPRFDFFTYKGKRIGAHSGSSSDDLFFILGIERYKNIATISYTRERHGIKTMVYPELKNEINIFYQRKINKQHSMFFVIEYEKIMNFSFSEDKTSSSKIIWFGYSLTF